MPEKATSKAQQQLMAIAEHSPSMVKGKNRGVLKMSHEELRGFAKTSVKNKPEHVGMGRRAGAGKK